MLPNGRQAPCQGVDFGVRIIRARRDQAGIERTRSWSPRVVTPPTANGALPRHRVQNAAELVDAGLFTRQEYRTFRRAEGFLLAVRCHLHTITGRAEDRLTFDLQRAVSERMNFADRPGKSAVERFMQFYFLQAKRVGSLTGVFLAHIDEQLAQKRASARLDSPQLGQLDASGVPQLSQNLLPGRFSVPQAVQFVARSLS